MFYLYLLYTENPLYNLENVFKKNFQWKIHYYLKKTACGRCQKVGIGPPGILITRYSRKKGALWRVWGPEVEMDA